METVIWSDDIDWVPLRPGLGFKPLSFFPDDTGYQLLLRLESGRSGRQRSLRPLPSMMAGIAFSTRDARVLDCLAPEKCSSQPR